MRLRDRGVEAIKRRSLDPRIRSTAGSESKEQKSGEKINACDGKTLMRLTVGRQSID